MIESLSNVIQGWVAEVAQIEIKQNSLLKYEHLFTDGGGIPNITIALQTAINDVIALPDAGAAIYIPAGRYRLSAPIVINTYTDKISIRGDGMLATHLIRDTDYGNTFELITCPQSSFTDFGICMYGEMTYGAHFDCMSLYRCIFDRLYISEPYHGILLKDCTGVFISNTVFVGAKYFTDAEYKSGSSMLKMQADDAGLNNNIAVSNCSFDGSGLPPETTSKYHYSIWCESVDGFWISNSHVMAAHVAHVGILPRHGYTLSGLRFANCWFDFHAVRCVEILADGTQPVQDVGFTNCIFQGAIGKGCYVNSPYLTGLNFTGCTFEYNEKGAMVIYAGKNISITGCIFKGNNGGLANGSTAIFTSALTSNVAISGNVFDAGPSVYYHIDTGGAQPTNWLESGNVFSGATISNIYLA